MTARDLINKDKATVRQSASLYALYKSLFFEAFGREPICPTCGSPEGHKDWQAFKAYAMGADPNNINLNTIIMSDNQKKDFAVKVKSKIYKFFRETKSGKTQIVRQYGDVMTEEFALEYLENAKGDATLFKQRSADFSILPKKYRAKKEKAADATGTDATGTDATGTDATGTDATGTDATGTDATGTDATGTDAEKLPTSLKGLKALAEERGYPEDEWSEIKTIKDMTLYVETKALTGEEDLLS